MRADRVMVHGTYMAYQDQGVFLEGESGIGKSTLALSLLTKGFALVADDCIIFTKKSNFVFGFAPRSIRGFAMASEFINIPQRYGVESVKKMAKLRLICHLVSPRHPLQSSDKPPTIVYHHILGMPFLKVYVPVCSFLETQQTIELMVKELLENQ